METERFQISVTQATDRLLKLWAAIDGTNRARLVVTLINKEIKEQWDDVEQQIEASAQALGMTAEEFIEQILKENSE